MNTAEYDRMVKLDDRRQSLTAAEKRELLGLIAMQNDHLDHWNDGALDAIGGKGKQSDNPEYLEGYEHGLMQRRVTVVMPSRPEGYYHAPVGIFE